MRLFKLVKLALMSAAALALPLLAAAAPAADSAALSTLNIGHTGLSQITPANVGSLVQVWQFNSGDMVRKSGTIMRRTKLQVKPLLADGKLLVCTPFNEVIALDPGSGKALWRFDPQLPADLRPGNMFNCRGVVTWRDPQAPVGAACRDRVLAATNDARLLALDLADGKPCAGFGDNGQLRIAPGIELLWPGEWQITSAPVVVRGRVVVGSSISDNVRAAAPRGTVHAFDARTGAPAWEWDPIPRNAGDEAATGWGDGWKSAGHANVWAPISADEARGMVYLPTSSPSPDFYGGLRPGDNRHANSVVALEVSTGRPAWSFQTVHHDIWDYDVGSPPALATLMLDGKPRDAVVQGTKTGMVFVLDRDTGKPLLPVQERPVPQGAVKGEWLSPTQPFPADLPLLGPTRLTADEAFGVTPWDRGVCRRAIESARNEGMFTPPSEQGTIVFPFTGGGVNWGGLAIDPDSDIVYVNSNRLVHRVTLFDPAQFDEMRKLNPRTDLGRQRGAPFSMKREVMLSPLGLPCNKPPWAVLSALDLRQRKLLWQVPLGTTEESAPLGIALNTGTATFGGPLHSATGLVFIGAALDRYLRAFDARDGRELWLARLPAAPLSTPASYEWQGRQYLVIAAGGHGEAGSAPSDAILAFALPGAGDQLPSAWQRLVDRPGRRAMFKLAAMAAGLLVLVAGLVAWRRRRRRLH